jgi:integrase
MKNKKSNLPDFVMPLSNEVIEILEEQHNYTKNRSYVFVGDSGKHIHPETGNLVLKKLDFNNEAKGRKQRMHSFRGTFRSIAETEHNANDAVKEIALDHFTQDRVKLAYTNKANYEKQLRELMSWWSRFIVDMLD